jgi:hypothetical protein
MQTDIETDRGAGRQAEGFGAAALCVWLLLPLPKASLCLTAKWREVTLSLFYRAFYLPALLRLQFCPLSPHTNTFNNLLL